MATKHIHHYHPITGEYIETTPARQDPMDNTQWLIPANAAEVAPPAPQNGHTRTFDKTTNEWSQIPDHRGQKYWTEKGERIEINTLGHVPPSNALNAPPPPPLAEYKKEVANKIDEAAGNARQRFVSNGQMIVEEYAMAEQQATEYLNTGGDVPPTIQHWADLNNLTPTEAVTDIITRASALYSALETIRAERLTAKYSISNATDHETVSAAFTTGITAINAITPVTTGS